MALGPGTRLGGYEIIDLLGSGGMGEVYRARDLKLQRDVAIKVLPKDVHDEPERLARFEREAKTLATLSHPNIAHVHGFDDSRGAPALVMELVEGPTLADRIAKGPIPRDEALPIAKQIAEGLEAAHDQGIIHRDLKPANIKVRDDGSVKILDFGLAKALEPKLPSGVNVTQSPTITTPAMMTGIGVILGTAAYMSPEQAKGRPADKRSDIWAFGCVLFEMLTGKQVFEGETVSDRFASILRAEPAWGSLPPVSAAVRLLLEQCLRKDARHRLQHIGDARIVLESEGSDDLSMPHPVPRRAGIELTLWRAATLILLIATLALAARLGFREGAEKPRVTRFLVFPPDKGAFESGIGGAENWPFPELSPDGLRLAFTARDSSRSVMLWVRSFDTATPQALPGTEGAGTPFWSPDSRSIAFFANGKLKKVGFAGGPVQDVCDATLTARGGTWGRDGVILFSSSNGGPLYRVSSNGGKPVAETDLANGQTSHRAPAFLPDGHQFLFFASGRADVSGLYLATLDSKGSVRLPVMTDSGATYSRAGHLLFTRQGILFHQPFDIRTHEVRNEPTPITEHVAYFAGLRAFSASDKGDLAFWSSTMPDEQLTWLDRTGHPIETVGQLGNYRGVDLSPDGAVLVHRHDTSGGDIFIVDRSHGEMKRLTFDASQHNSSPIWSANGSEFIFQSFRSGKWSIFRKRAIGVGDDGRIFESDVNAVPLAWSADERSILFWWLQAGGGIWAVSTTGNSKPALVARASSDAQFSPDGKWLLYTSVEKGASEVYLQPVGSPERRLQVSPNGGAFPRWRADGKELFYITTPERGLVAVRVNWLGSGSDVNTGSPIKLFDVGQTAVAGHSGGPFHYYAVSPDGQRFLLPRPVSSLEANASPPITVIQNWLEELQARVATK